MRTRSFRHYTAAAAATAAVVVLCIIDIVLVSRIRRFCLHVPPLLLCVADKGSRRIYTFGSAVPQQCTLLLTAPGVNTTASIFANKIDERRQTVLVSRLGPDLLQSDRVRNCAPEVIAGLPNDNEPPGGPLVEFRLVDKVKPV